MDLEVTLDIPVQELGKDFRATMPVLVITSQGVVERYLFGAGAKYYLYDGLCGDVYEFGKGGGLTDVLIELERSHTEGTRVLVGRIERP